MKYFLPIYILFLAFALFALIRSQAHIDRLEAIVAESNEKIAQNERNEAERHSIEVTRIDTLRSVVYRDRIRAEVVFRDIIQQTPPDSVVYARLDSCVQVGSLVLRELELSDSARLHLDSVVFAMRSVVSQGDSALVKERVKSERLKRQRNLAIGAAVIGFIVGLI